MKVRLRVLGVSCLAAGVLMAATGQVHAESVSEGNQSIEVVKQSEEAIVVAQSSKEEALVAQDKQETTVSSSNVEQTQTQSSEAPVEKELKIWDIAFDAKTRVLTGKTEPNAKIVIVNTDLENAVDGVVTADANGNFVHNNPTMGLLRLEATLGDRKSAYYEIDVEGPLIAENLRFKYFNYSIGTKTLQGETAPYATVYVYLPSTGGQGMISADQSGSFSITDQFSPGIEVVLTAQDEFGNKGEPVTYTIPTQEVMDSLEIREVAYDFKTKTITGKTAPNVSLFIGIKGGGEALIKADAAGNFAVSDSFTAGSVVRMTAYKDNIYGNTFEYTIPEEATQQTSESTTQPTTESSTESSKEATTAKPKGKDGLPNTGEKQTLLFSFTGGVTLLGAAYLIFKRKFARNR